MPHRLTPREREIAGLIAQGLSGPEIARRLVLSIRTVEGHVYRARTKLDAPTRHDLARVVADSVSPHRPCPDCPLVNCDGSTNGRTER
jgi:DNA-binding CsgD family transcriptional regulator